MKKDCVLVVGGGACGMVAAISSASVGKKVILCERKPVLGKKIFVSGGGRCNLLNEDLRESYYNREAQSLVKSIFSKFGKRDILEFFKELGLVTYSQGSRIFPITNQASSVVKVLDNELKRLGVNVEVNFEVKKINFSKDRFIVLSKDNRDIESNKVIIATGGKSYPALGSDGSGYNLAESFGHTILQPFPIGVPLVIKDKFCHLLSGQKIFAKVKLLINNEVIDETEGEILFTNYGISGTAILDVSGSVSYYINIKKTDDIFLSIDMVPFWDKDSLTKEINRRLNRGIPKEEVIVGILPNKFSNAFRDYFGNTAILVDVLKDKCFKVKGTRGWNEAEFTGGGVNINEVKEGTLESKLKGGLYFAGEVLNVCGKRGGYNLAWAWASGFVVGLTL
ncbi:MAG: aminoacetone oxidase family FAD-binding enzyme [Candidatus Omnitrophica bacterium]|nr:aminoacetone oxidase family FAD-binding enzyme [Candidatus Omnitrophota bacterium]MCM8826749.1 aminoacetone oxidase family FAD-binding enzyme [Candidatus Omnitrophota bacterium]